MRNSRVRWPSLVWHEVYPAWDYLLGSGSDPPKSGRARVSQIVRVFAGLIDRWDVVNEATMTRAFSKWNWTVGEARRRSEDGDGRVGMGQGESRSKATLLYNDYNIGPAFERLVTELAQAKRPRMPSGSKVTCTAVNGRR